MFLHTDFETRSHLDIKKVGLDNYARAAEAILLAWAIDDGPVTVEENPQGVLPWALSEALGNPSCVKVAWNCGFEQAIFEHCLGIRVPNEQWLDPSVLARSVSLPGGLNAASEALGLDATESKQKSAGTRLINKFSKPKKKKTLKSGAETLVDLSPEQYDEYAVWFLKTCMGVKAQPRISSIYHEADREPINKAAAVAVTHTETKDYNPPELFFRDRVTDPEDWKLFVEYCRQDVIAERAILHKLRAFNLSPLEYRVYLLDQKINQTGIPVSLEFVEAARSRVSTERAKLTAELKQLTGLANPNSVKQLTPWLRDRGYSFQSLGAPKVRRALSCQSDVEVQ